MNRPDHHKYVTYTQHIFCTDIHVRVHVFIATTKPENERINASTEWTCVLHVRRTHEHPQAHRMQPATCVPSSMASSRRRVRLVSRSKGASTWIYIIRIHCVQTHVHACYTRTFEEANKKYVTNSRSHRSTGGCPQWPDGVPHARFLMRSSTEQCLRLDRPMWGVDAHEDTLTRFERICVGYSHTKKK